MTQSLIAAQLYTLRDHCKTALDLAESLRKVRKIGYEAVQLSGLGPIDPKDVARVLQDTELHACATHVGLEAMRKDFDGIVKSHKLWNCSYTAIGGNWPAQPYTRKVWLDFVDEYNQLAQRFAAEGLTIGYHNHNHEFTNFEGTTPFQLLVDGLKAPAFIEIDTYWVTAGGGDPIAWINKVTNRLPLLHLKDMAFGDGKQKMAEVGEGNLNFPGIISAGLRAGTRWFIVEQDDCNGKDPFDCLATSYRNVRNMGLR